MSIDSACSVLRASSTLPCRRSSIASCSRARLDQALPGVGQRLQPSLELGGIAVIELALVGHQAGEVAQQRVGAGVRRPPRSTAPPRPAGRRHRLSGRRHAAGRGSGSPRAPRRRAGRAPASWRAPAIGPAPRQTERRRRHPAGADSGSRTASRPQRPRPPRPAAMSTPGVLFQQLFSTLCPEVFLDLVENINHADFSPACFCHGTGRRRRRTIAASGCGGKPPARQGFIYF